MNVDIHVTTISGGKKDHGTGGEQGGVYGVVCGEEREVGDNVTVLFQKQTVTINQIIIKSIMSLICLFNMPNALSIHVIMC